LLCEHQLSGVESGQDGRRHSTTRSWQLSPVYEQQSAPDSASTGAGVLGGFLTLLGGPARRRPFRSTSVSNVAGCGGAATATTPAAPAPAGGTLSTARPLRVYTRSSTDTELYRRRPGSARPPVHVVSRQQYSEHHGRPAD